MQLLFVLGKSIERWIFQAFSVHCLYILVNKHTNTFMSQFFQESVRRWWSPLSGVDLQNVPSRLPYKIRLQHLYFKFLRPFIISTKNHLSELRFGCNPCVTFYVLSSLLTDKELLQFPTSLSGKPKRNSLSKRPGLLRAGSMESSLFVAPITTTSPLASNPSIRAKRVDTMELQRTKRQISNWSTL